MDISFASQIEKLLPGWIADLGENNGLVRQQARLMLIHHGKASLPSLLTALKDESTDIRLEAVKALGKLRDPTTATTLAGMLADEDTGVRWAVTESLIHLGRAGLRPVLDQFVKNFASVWMRESVHHILHVLKDRYLLTEEEYALFEKLDKKEIPGFETGWNTEAAWAAEKALEALDQQTR
jgi:HEAT repeat protein